MKQSFLISFAALKFIYDSCSSEWFSYGFLQYLYEKEHRNFDAHFSILIESKLIYLNDEEVGSLNLFTEASPIFDISLFLRAPEYSKFHLELYSITQQMSRSKIVLNYSSYMNEFRSIVFLVESGLMTRISNGDKSRLCKKFIYNIDNKNAHLVRIFKPLGRMYSPYNDIEKKQKGLKAEKIVMEYETNRLQSTPSLLDKLKHMSLIDDSLGYDVLSATLKGQHHLARYIEVKALDCKNGFYLSQNQKKYAELMGNLYFLYLVNIKTGIIQIIKNPARVLFTQCEEWEVKVDHYYIRKKNNENECHI